MNRDSLLIKVGKGLRVLSGLELALALFQCAGVLVYALTVYPGLEHAPPAGITALALVAAAAGLARSGLWVGIYWTGARTIAVLREHGESPALPSQLLPALGALTRLLVASCVLDVLLLPAIFLMDSFFPFKLGGAQLGMTQAATLLLPQAFGVAALLLAYLARQYGLLVQERCRMRSELELTI